MDKATATRWTDDQRRAIEERGRTVLVSAAAGSGKTAVLTERAVRRMLDPIAPISADRLLVVTFTRAAAQEMKQRMQKKLAQVIAEQPGNAQARRQRQLLQRAIIGTIDALCLELLRRHRQAVGLPAAFRVGDAQELAVLRDEAVGEVLEAAYQNEGDDAFLGLSQLLSQRQGDQSLADTVLRVLDFARTHPFYLEWLDEKLTAYSRFENPAQSAWGQIMLQYAAEAAQYGLQSTEQGCAAIAADPALANYGAAFAGDAAYFALLCKTLATGDWDAAVSAARGYAALPLRAVAKSADPDTKAWLKRLRERNKKLVERLCKQVFAATLAEFGEDVADLLPKLRRLFALVRETDARMFDKKCASGLFDFSDLEQFAVQLLMRREKKDYRPTDLALQLRQDFDEIMVDEYQDVNAVQDMLINALSSGENLFLVGDVKQSIYRFRQARPELFLARSARYAQNTAPGEPTLVTLGGNFRSRPEIADGVNCIFTPLFSKRVGELEYDAGHRLTALSDFLPVQGAGVSLHLLEQGELRAAEAADCEARYAARQIRALLENGAPVSENGALRPMRAGDIAILLRSPKSRAEIYRRALAQEGIEAFAALETGFLQRTEIAALLNLLRAVQNPTLDIALIGAMISPLFGFTDDELAAVRLALPRGGFYRAVCARAAQQDAHCRAFLETFARLRRLSLTADAVRVINEAMTVTGFDLCCRAMPDGEQRFANLALLGQYAAQYHQNGHRGLAAFLRIVERTLARGEDWAPAYVGEQKNAVTITSIHKSKGLEWPVVFLCDAGRQHSFYRHDLTAPTILHSELGFACVRRVAAQKRQFATVPLEAVRLETARAALSEELRVLYVAMTRAKERLVVTAGMKKAAETAAACDGAEGAPLPFTVREQQSYAQWMLLALSTYGGVERALMKNETLGKVALHLDYCALLLPQSEPEGPQQQTLDEMPPTAPPDEALIDALGQRLAFAYPFAAACGIPAKLSVSQITHPQQGMFFAREPVFLEQGKPKPAAPNERGSAVHAFMQFCDYAAARIDSAAELERLRATGILTARQARLVDLKQVDTFFKSALAQRMFDCRELLREYAFMVSAADLPPDMLGRHDLVFDADAAMLQGIADCVLLFDDHAELVDYKTDRVRTAEELRGRYTAQLTLYRAMLGTLLPVPVTRCVLWSFALGREVQVAED